MNKTTSLSLCTSFLLAGSVLAMPDVSYFLDDGTGESGFGGFGTTTVWLNSFESVAGGEHINEVSISFGAAGADPSIYNGLAIGLYIWSDPDDDGIPDDAVLEASTNGVISDFTNTSISTSTGFVDFTFDNSVEITAGETFFVGMSLYIPSASVFGPARDTGTSEGRSWIYRWNSDNPNAANAMSTADVQNNYDDIFGGNAMIRAGGQATAVPESSAFALVAGIFVAATCLFRRRG